MVSWMPEPDESEAEIFDRIVRDLKGGRTLDDLTPEESACFAAKARQDESSQVPGSSGNRENWDEESPVDALSSQKAFEKFLEENLAEFAKGMNPRSKLMLIVLGRELKSHRPAARIQATRLLGELLGIFKRGKDGAIRPDSGNSGGADFTELENLISRATEDD